MERNGSNVKTSRKPAGAALRRDDVTDALTRAFFQEWARVGYADMSLERVARSVGSGKAALYRRWPDKATMAADLLPKGGLTITDIADQGSFQADLGALLIAIRRVLRHPIIRRIVADIHAEQGRNPHLAAVVRPFQEARRARAMLIIDRAITRGERPTAVDRELAADLMAAPLYWRMVVLRQRADRIYLKQLARLIITGLASDVR